MKLLIILLFIIIYLYYLIRNIQISIKPLNNIILNNYLKKKNIILNLKEKNQLIKFNNIRYKVNNLYDYNKAANTIYIVMCFMYILLSKIIYDKNINNIIDKFLYNYNYIISREKFKEYLKIIYKKIPYIILKESPLNNDYTSYNINKGEEINLCIRDKKTLIIQNLNEIIYVAIHEISHIGCPEIGHTNIFYIINHFLLNRAICMNIYNYVDYNKENKNYCGIILKSNIIKSNDLIC